MRCFPAKRIGEVEPKHVTAEHGDGLLEENGLKPGQCRIDRDALMRIVEDYTREAGVRELERRVAAVCRSVAALFAKGERDREMHIDSGMVHSILGPPKYVREIRLKTGNPGVVTGLAWTPAGGAFPN